MAKYLTTKEAAQHYGEKVKYSLLSPDGCDWEKSKGIINGEFIVDMENANIKKVELIKK